MLHWIARPDPQSDLHDHPVSFLSIVLSGSYVEELPDDTGERRTVRVRRWNLKRATDRHRIVSVTRRALTLVFSGPAVREWGFYTPEGWVPWREYDARRRAENSHKRAASHWHDLSSDESFAHEHIGRS
jgi:hypothetical protein